MFLNMGIIYIFFRVSELLGRPVSIYGIYIETGLPKCSDTRKKLK